MAFCAECGIALVAGAAALLLGSACGGSTPAPQTEEPAETSSAPASAGARGPGLAIESEVGALDERKVKEAFDRVSPKIMDCFHRAAEHLPYLAGNARFQVHVAPDGSARSALLVDSTLGDRSAEACMMSALKATSWPKPVGGHEGIAENTFTFDAGDERPPVDWTPEQLGKPLKRAWPALSKCRASTGAGAIKVTLYVETSGKPAAIGASAADEKGEAAIPCIIDALKPITFPSPGSYASKATIAIE